MCDPMFISYTTTLIERKSAAAKRKNEKEKGYLDSGFWKLPALESWRFQPWKVFSNNNYYNIKCE
jgi:hypothetical protein